MARLLTDFLRRSACEEFEYGKNDCVYWTNKWVILRRGSDLSVDFSGSYKTAIGCQRALKKAGGLVSLVDAATRKFGIKRTDDPKIGDVVCVEINAARTLAIKTQIGFAMKAPRGVTNGRAPVIAAWSI